MARRTTHRSSTGKKLYAVRNAKGQITDIQTYERSHRADLARTSKAEAAAAQQAGKPAAKAKRAASPATRKAAAKRKAASGKAAGAKGKRAAARRH